MAIWNSGDRIRLAQWQIKEMKEETCIGGVSSVGEENEEGVVGGEEETKQSYWKRKIIVCHFSHERTG